MPRGGRRSAVYFTAVFTILSLLAFYHAPSSASGWLLPSSFTRYREHDKQVIANIRALVPLYEKRFPPGDWNQMRANTSATLLQLADCMESRSCTTAQRTVTILGSMHFGSSQTGGHGGEAVWAGSIIDIIGGEGYTILYAYSLEESYYLYQALPDMIPLVINDAMEVKDCAASVPNVPVADSPSSSSGEAPASTGCPYLKRVSTPNGIPVWKLRSYHFWLGQNHPLKGWTVSPEDFAEWGGGNYYLGYHLPHCIGRTKSLTRLPRALVLGKQAQYFSSGQYAWPTGSLKRISQELKVADEPFTFVGASGDTPDDLPEGIKNLGGMKKEQWQEELRKSAAMLGIGRPVLSPSPYDSLCLGVPFINPILERDENAPYDREKWNSQHNQLKILDPPYVYNVWSKDHEALRKALHDAWTNPIEPYIPEWMTREAVSKRVLALITLDWESKAREQVMAGKSEGWAFGPKADKHNGLML